MPVLSAKSQRSGFEALAAKVEAKKKEEREKEIANEALKKFSIKSLDKGNATDTAGATLQNPTTDLFNISLKSSVTEDRQKQSQTEPTATKDTSKNENEKKSSIISGSQKIQELQEIQRQLSKNYEPKPLFEPRRPTLESIKSAIEKAKLDEMSRNKNVGTENDDVVTIVTTSDAATSVEKVKKKLKKKKPLDIVSAGSTASPSASNKSKKSVVQTKNPKKIEVNIKVKAKVDTSNPYKSGRKQGTVKRK